MKIRLKKEYFYWAFFWIQMTDFSKSFSPYIIVEGYMRFYQIMNVIFILVFLGYVIVNVNKGFNDRVRQLVQGLLMFLMLVIMGSYCFYIFSNPWLYEKGTELMVILNEIYWPVSLFAITSFAFLLSFRNSEVMERNYAQFWNTPVKNDVTISVTLYVVVFLFTIVSSKLMPGIMRDYFNIFQTLLSILLLSILLKLGQSFTFLRRIYYQALFSFGAIFVLEYVFFVLFTRGIVMQINEKVTTGLQLSIGVGALGASLFISCVAYIIKTELQFYAVKQEDEKIGEQ